MSKCYINKDSNCCKSLFFAVARRAQDCIEVSHFLHGHAVPLSCSYLKLRRACGTGIKKDQITLK